MRLSVEGEINLTGLSKAIEELELEKMVLKAVVERAQERLVSDLCGDGYKRNGTKQRLLITKLGKLGIRAQRLVSPGGEWSMPILGLLGLKGKERYTRDLKAECADTALKLSYRDSEEEVAKRGLKVSKSRIHRFVQELGPLVKTGNEKQISEQSVVMGDGTKAHGIGRKNDINVVIGVGTQGKELLGVTVNRSWVQTGSEANGRISGNAVLVADAEKAIRNALKNEDFQLDIHHAIKEVSYKLWQHQAPKEDRDEVLSELKRILYTLKNSVEKHIEDKDMDRLGWRVERTLRDLKRLAKRAKKRGYWRVTKFIRNSANHMVTFARLVITGIRVPETSNMIERLMGEIAKRVKNRWAHWSERGLQNLLSMLLARYCNKSRYNEILDRYVYGPYKDISVGAELTLT